MGHTCDTSIWEVVGGASGVQGYPWLPEVLRSAWATGESVSSAKMIKKKKTLLIVHLHPQLGGMYICIIIRSLDPGSVTFPEILWRRARLGWATALSGQRTWEKGGGRAAF